MNDREKTRKVIDEMLRGADGSLVERSAALFLDNLMVRYGGDYTIKGACNALDDLSRTAQQTKEALCATFRFGG